MEEILFFVVLVLALLCPWLLLSEGEGRWFWFGTFAAILLAVGFGELGAYLGTGKTLSQLFWAYSLNHETRAWVILASLTIGWCVLIWHLAAKMLKRRKGE